VRCADPAPGCQALGYLYREGLAVIEFSAHQRGCRFMLPLPQKEDFRTFERRGKQVEASPELQMRNWEQACRQKWRALCLAIKAKLEAVESGISHFEDEFLSQIIDPITKKTVGELIRPELEQRYIGKDSTQLALPEPRVRTPK